MKKLPRWQKEQKQKKSRKRLKLAWWTLAVISLVATGGLIYQGWRVVKTSQWDGQGRLTLAFNTAPILIASYEPEAGKLDLLTIPGNTQLEAVGGYGLYQARSLWNLGELEVSGKIFTESLEVSLAIPVDGWLNPGEKDAFFLNDNQAKVRKDYLIENLIAAIKNRQTSLNRWDLIRLYWGVRKVRLNQVSLVALGQTSALGEISLADGTPAYEIKDQSLDVLISDLFADEKIKNEALAIGVYNSSQYPGLANKASRMIDNLGGRTIEIGDWEGKTDGCEIRSQKQLASTQTVKKMINIFGCQQIIEDMSGERADVILVIGEDYWHFLDGR
jgi:hypothetical protein